MTLIDFLRRHGIPYSLSPHKNVRPGWVGVDCPRCRTTGKYHLGIPIGGGGGHCWQCDDVDPLWALSIASGLTRRDVAAELADWDSRPREAPQRVRQPARRPAGVVPLSHDLAVRHRRYLESRGFRPEVLEELWGLMATGPAGPAAWRVLVPIGANGVEIGWTARSIVDGVVPKYLTMPGMDLSDILYGWDYVRQAVILVEGPADAWRLGPGAVALLGQALTPARLEMLTGMPRVFICLDADAAKRAGEMARRLEGIVGDVYRINLPDGDPGDLPRDEVAGIREKVFGETGEITWLLGN